MKKIFTFLMVLFWSMIFPGLSFNEFTTDMRSRALSSTPLLYDSNYRKELLQNAEFDFFFFK